MSLQSKVTEALKEAMKAKNTIALESLRAIKSAILLANTQAGAAELSEDDEIKLLQKLVKQRKESADLYAKQNREDLAKIEIEQAEIIAQFLPKQLNNDEVEAVIKQIIEQVEAVDMKDMGKVMGEATKQLSGKADGKVISEIVKKLLV